MKIWLAITRHLPRVRGAGWFANKIKSFYNRKTRPNVTADVLGFYIELEPAECVDGALLFYPQLYDAAELAYLTEHLDQGGVFVDVGANIGIYSHVASRIVGDSGKVVAVEADPYNFAKLKHNIEMNDLQNVRIVEAGVSDCEEALRLHQQTRGNRGGSTFCGSEESKGVIVRCYPMAQILMEQSVRSVSGMKMDIEGFEYKVLCSFFDSAKKILYPGFLILEMNEQFGLEEKLAYMNWVVPGSILLAPVVR